MKNLIFFLSSKSFIYTKKKNKNHVKYESYKNNCKSKWPRYSDINACGSKFLTLIAQHPSSANVWDSYETQYSLTFFFLFF